jgi:hypothetical protein
MSWQLTAGRMIDILSRWDDLDEDARWLARQYLLECERVSFSEAEHKCIRAAVDKLLITRVLCWNCEESVHTKFPYGPNYAEDVPDTWLKNAQHLYSGVLCPQCQKDKKVRAAFLHKDPAIWIRKLAEYAPAADRAPRDVAKWVIQLVSTGPHGALPETLVD